MLNSFSKKEIKNNLLILIGALSISLAVVLFLVPNSITTGGTPGMGILLHHLTGWSVGSMIFIVNLPLLIWGYRSLGKVFAIKTIIVILMVSVFVDFFKLQFENVVLTNDIFLASVFGGILIGFGLGVIMKGGASTGGSTIVAKAMKNSHIKPAQIILVTDVIIVVSSIFVFKDVEKVLWSIVNIYVIAKVIDVVLTGTISTKVIHISTTKAEKLSHAITKNLAKHGTILHGSGLYKNEDRTLILMVLDIKKIGRLKEIIEVVDKEAFMVVMEASEMLDKRVH